jgi:hypothetical protein
MRKILVVLLLICPLWVGAEDKRIAQTAFKILLGPFVQAADGVTPMTALTVTTLVIDWYQPYTSGIIETPTPQAPVRITATASAGTNDMRHVLGGIYELEITAAQVPTSGTYRAHIYGPTFRPVFQEFEVQEAASFNANIKGVLATSTGIRDLILSDGTAFPGAKIAVLATDVDDLQTRVPYVSRKGVGFTWPMQFYQQANPTLPIGAGIQPTCTRAIDNLTFQSTASQPIPTNAFGGTIINLAAADMGGDEFVWLRCTATGAIAYGYVFKIQKP